MYPKLLTFIALFHWLTFYAGAQTQSSLCLRTDPATGHIDFQPAALNELLHLDRYKIIFFGEQHNNKFDPEIKYHLITDLNKRSGVRHVFMEVSVSLAWRFNQYLLTGDTLLLYKSSKGYKPDPYTVFSKRLYEYNSRLPETQKIIVHGVDFERTDVFPTLKQLATPGKLIPASLRPVMDTINAHLEDPPLAMWDIIDNKFILYDNSKFVTTLRYVQEQFGANLNDTKDYFGANFPVVNDIIKNKSKVEVRANHRNKSMFAAMQKTVTEHKIERFIGFFGAEHTKYSIGRSLTNASKSLRGFEAKDMLNICEMAYNLKSTDTAFRVKHYKEIVDLNGTCRATVLPSNLVPGYKKDADFVIVTNIGDWDL
jgi:hypothetical protein